MTRRIGHYHLIRAIGSGGMGTVYEATQEHPRRTVAVKIMNRGVVSRAALRRFENESQMLARLTHPNIAQVYDAGTYVEEAGPVPYFVMEYIPNARPITEYARESRLAVRERLELFTQVCDAVQHGHQKGIIHRDLKPGNIIVDSNGHVKIIDFGVARATDSDLTVTTLQTGAGQLLGTLQYMSPEQVEADPHGIDARADVYSLGVVLYELLSDRLPYDVARGPVLEAARIIREEPPTPLSAAHLDLRGDLETIVHTALEKERGRRYQTAESLRQDILRYLNGEPITAHRPSVAYHIGRHSMAMVKRHPIVAMAAVVLVAVLFAQTVGVPIVYRWDAARDLYKRFVVSVPWPGPGSGSLATVRVIRITDGTMDAVERLAEAQGFADVTPQDFKSLRRLHGRLMERLAEAGVRSVSWDLTFARDLPFDEDFLRGVEALKDAGAEVVVGVRKWPLGDQDGPEIGSAIARAVRWGGTTAHLGADADWNLHLFLQRGDKEPQPSLALRTLAAYLHPEAEPAYEADPQGATLKLRYFQYPDPQNPRDRRWLAESDLVRLSAIEPYGGEPADGRLPGDLVGICILRMPGDPELAAASVDYEWVMDGDVNQLRDRLHGKAVLIGDFRKGRELSQHPDGRWISAVYSHAAGIDALVRAAPIRVESVTFAWIAALATALLGIVVGAAAAGCARRRISVLGGAALMLLCASILAYRLLGYFVNALVPLMAMVIACEAGAWVSRTRQAQLR